MTLQPVRAPRPAEGTPAKRRGLAALGQAPRFAAKLHVGRPNLGHREKLLARLEHILDECWLTNDGPFVREFEQEIAARLGVRHCVAMCNATIALEIAARALGLAGEVIVPSFTFVATAHALQWQQITPVFADIDPHTHNIDPAAVDRLVSPRTTGVVGVHLWGRPCDVEALGAVAARHDLKVMYDAAHAFGCSHGGRPLGGNGDCEVFSFHATKFVNAFEGGAITTNDDRLAETARLMRNFGFTGYDRVSHVGTNGKMSEVSAAMGLTSLESLDAIVHTNRRNYHAYQRGLAGVPGVHLARYDAAHTPNYQYVVAEVEPGALGLTRDQLLLTLWAENVIARRYFWPGCHRMEPYQSLQPEAGLHLPVTEAVASRVLLLPTGTAVSADAVAEICDIVREAAWAAPLLAAQLPQHAPTPQDLELALDSL